jgi:hypothetical protein
MNTINFQFTIEQTNKILMALNKMPYEMVVDLINDLHKQAQPQVSNQPRSMPVPPSVNE